MTVFASMIQHKIAEPTQDQLCFQVNCRVWNQVYDRVCEQVWDRVEDQLVESMWEFEQ
jgi:hypothetical protein